MVDEGLWQPILSGSSAAIAVLRLTYKNFTLYAK